MLISESAMEVHPSRGALHKVTLKPGELHRPDIAWPTVLFAVFSIMLWTSVAAIGVVREWAPYFTVPVSTAAVYMNFTPLHDAAHASVSRKYRCLNQAVGWMCSVPFLIVPFPLWTWAHLQHHKHTNDPEKDPDYNEWENPLLYVLSNVPRFVHHIVRNSRAIPGSAFAWSALQLCAVAVGVSIGVENGLGGALLQYAFVPALVAVPLLGVVFDYVPHASNKVARKDDLYGCTGIVGGVFTRGSGPSTRVLTLLLCGQNYHAIHHLYPSVPCYAYGDIWRSHQSAFLHAGVPMLSLRECFQPRRHWG